MEAAATLFAVVVSLAVSVALGWWLCRLPRFGWASRSPLAGAGALCLRILIFGVVVVIVEPVLLILWLNVFDSLGLESEKPGTEIVKGRLMPPVSG